MKRSERRIPFFEQRFIKPLWVLRREQEGCTIEDVEEFYVSTERLAPLLRDQPPSPPAPPKPKAPERPPKSLIESILEFREWLNTPPPPKPTPTPAAPAIKKPRIKPFDLQDIPGAMDRIGWPMSAKVMRKWLSGELNYADSDEGARIGINQNGDPFPQSMIDTTMFKLKWILGFERAKEKYDWLIDESIYSKSAREAIIKIFSKHRPSPYHRDAWKLCDGDMHRYHNEFQFQLKQIDSENTEKFLMLLRGIAMPHGLLMDDLYGSLGAFSLNAAIGGFFFHKVTDKRMLVEILDISVYMRDVFTFHDRGKRGSQYLGHWNRKGFIIVPSATALGEITSNDWIMAPVARHGIISDHSIYHPVRNKDYRDWQLKHNQGGDLILYSDRRQIRLQNRLIVEFDL
ncbi:DUF6402 family protein [Cupriavidus sp. PET2-C1]